MSVDVKITKNWATTSLISRPAMTVQICETEFICIFIALHSALPPLLFVGQRFYIFISIFCTIKPPSVLTVMPFKKIIIILIKLKFVVEAKLY